MGKLEEIEAKVKQEVKSRLSAKGINEEFFLKAELELTHDIQTFYLEELEKQAIDLHPPIQFLDTTNAATKRYVKERTIVFSVFALIENGINYLIRIKLNRNFGTTFLSEDGISEAVSIVLDSLNFGTKVEIIDVLYKDKKIDKQFLSNLKRIRNAFAHNLNNMNPKYIFNKRNVARDLYAFDDFVDKVLEIKKILEEIAERQPEVKTLHEVTNKILEDLKK